MRAPNLLKKRKEKKKHFSVFLFESPTNPKKPPPLSSMLLLDSTESYRRRPLPSSSSSSLFSFFNLDYPQTEPLYFHKTTARLHNPVHMPPRIEPSHCLEWQPNRRNSDIYTSKNQHGWDTPTSYDYHSHLHRMERIPTMLPEVPQ
jgi:hypothetical protein